MTILLPLPFTYFVLLSDKLCSNCFCCCNFSKKNGRQAPGQCSGKVAISYQRVSNFTDSQSAQVTKSCLPGKSEKQTRMRNFLPTTYCSGAKRLKKFIVLSVFHHDNDNIVISYSTWQRFCTETSK